MSRTSLPPFVWAALTLALWTLGRVASAAPMNPADVPEPLRAWIPWVLQPLTDQACPYVHGSESDRRCAWPSQLELSLGDQRGEFLQRWQMYAPGLVPLPGDERRWPQEVKVDGQPAVVLALASGEPGVELPAGAHEVSGVFQWDSAPEKLAVPRETGLLSLKLRGEAVPFPRRDASGTLWLQKTAPADGEQNLLDVVVHRMVSDAIPLRMTTEISLHAAGKNREELLGKALLPDFTPMEVTSELPARLEPDGRLRVQIRPGAWTIRVVGRHPGDLQQIGLPPTEGPWAEEEVWVFESAAELRRVELSGLQPVDPQQTQLPQAWRSFPAFRARPGETLRLTVTQRGEADRGPDQLALQRGWWLDFDGRAFTVQDSITGQVQGTRRLEVQESAVLGSAVAGGQPQFITALEGSTRSGIELRDPNVRVTADLRVPAGGMRTTISAVDWDQDFARVGGVLHLPPGWKVLHATGVDEVSATWLGRWTLLDLFLVLVIATAIGRLYGWAWGTLALVTLALVFPEWMAPRTVWLYVLVGEALWRVLPDGKVRQVVRAYRLAALVALVGVSTGFVVQQVRQGLYPALEERGSDDFSFGVARDREPAAANSDDGVWVQTDAQMQRGEEGMMGRPKPEFASRKEQKDEPVAGEDNLESLDEDQAAGKRKSKVSSYSAVQQQLRQQKLREYDANTVVQTGPGVPRWSWTAVPLRWSGPVERGQKVGLVLVPPHVNLALAGVRVLFLVTLLLAVFGVFRRKLAGTAGRAGTLLALALAGSAALAPRTAAAQVPDAETLAQLRARLVEAPKCLPRCLTSPRARIEATSGALRLVLEVHAAAEVAAPLPGTADQWLPTSVAVDGSPASGGLWRGQDGGLWVALKPGRHELVLEGPLPARETVQLPMHLVSHRVEAKTDGWTVAGLHEDGLADPVLQLTRVGKKEGGVQETLEMGTLPPFVRVERSLTLGLSWEVLTRVQRVTPPGAAVVLQVPLLPGESVTSADQRVEGGAVLVNMRPDQAEVEWTSVLPITSTLTLAAAVGQPWSEAWQVMVGPVWHVDAAGLTPIRRGAEGLQEWRPWPGEQVQLTISRPAGVPGATLTIDRVNLSLQPGMRATDATLNLELRASRGGHHVVTLPPGAQLQEVRALGSVQPIGQEGQQVRLPLQPGSQEVQLKWREPSLLGARYTGPVVDLGAPAVNTTVRVEFPRERWVLLLGGPRLGPAVLFWSYIVMLLIAAAVLGRLSFSPLRGHQWFLLGLGLSTIEIEGAMTVVGWFLLLGWRRQRTDLSPGWFDLRQLVIIGWTLAAWTALLASVHAGLLGDPDMQIRGNESYDRTLQWYQDRVETPDGLGGVLPRPWVFSVSMWWYRGLMLVWALWLAWSMVRWLPWGWYSVSSGGLWRPLRPPWRPKTPGHRDPGDSGVSEAIYNSHTSMDGTRTLAAESRPKVKISTTDTMEAPPPVDPPTSHGAARVVTGGQPVRPVAEDLAPPSKRPPPPPSGVRFTPTPIQVAPEDLVEDDEPKR